jgi:hypothetical protein
MALFHWSCRSPQLISAPISAQENPARAEVSIA